MKSRKKKKTRKNPPGSSGLRELTSTGPTEEQIPLRAYKLYVERGRADGEDLQD